MLQRCALIALVLSSLLSANAWGQQFTFRLEELSALPETVWIPVGLYVRGPEEGGQAAADGFAFSVAYPVSDVRFVCAHLAGGVLADREDVSVKVANDPAAGLAAVTVELAEALPLGAQEVKVLDMVFALGGGIPPGTTFPLTFPEQALVFIGNQSVSAQTQNGALSVPDDNILLFTDAEGSPGQQGIPVELRLFNRDPVLGLQVSGTFDNSVLYLRQITIEGTETSALNAEFFQPVINNEEGYFIVGILLEERPPVDFSTRYPVSGYQLTVATLLFDVKPEAEPGTSVPIRFVDGYHTPPIKNRLVVDFQSVSPTLLDGEFRITAAGEAFLRGNANQDDIINIADPIRILQLIFKGRPLDCEKAGDVNDDGEVSFDDPIYLLEYLFGYGPVIPPPFPDEGLDPTPDNLTCERYEVTPRPLPGGG